MSETPSTWQKIVNKLGVDPADKTAAQRLTDEFGTQAAGKSIPQQIKDKIGSNPSTGELARRKAVAAEETIANTGDKLKEATATAVNSEKEAAS